MGWLDAQAVGDLLQAAFDSFGYPLTFVGALLENTILLGAFLPGGAFILTAAAYAKLGTLQWPLVVFLGWSGMVLGNCFDYWVGRHASQPLLRRFDKNQRLSAQLTRARSFLARHGAWAVLAGHFLGHMRSFVAITAGSSHFPFGRYLLFEAVAALVWNLAYCSLGYLLASNLDKARVVLERSGLAALGILALAALAWWLVRRARPATGSTAG